MRRSSVFPIVALLLASVAAFAVHSVLRVKDARLADALSQRTEILVAARDLPLGTKLTASSVRAVKWPRDILPAGALRDVSAVTGSVVRQALSTNEPIVDDKLLSSDHKAGLLPLLIPPNMRAMSVAVDEVADIAGFVLPHTRVDILASATEGGTGRAGRTRIVLQNVEVLAVAQTTEKDQPQLEKVVTVLVTPEQAE